MNITDHNRALYENDFKDSDYYHGVYDKKVRKMISLINGKPKKILDLGCGDGWFGEMLKKKYHARVHGVDISDKTLRIAKKRGLITKKIDLSKGKWPYKSNTFDLIIGGDVIEHLYDTEFFVKECNRILKKGGQLILSTPNFNSYHNRVLILFGQPPLFIDFAPTIKPYKFFKVTGHVRAFNKKTMKKLLEKYNFKVEKTTGCGFSTNEQTTPKKYRQLIKLLNGVENFFGHIPSLATLLIVKAVKK